MAGMGRKLHYSTCLQCWQFAKEQTVSAFPAFWNLPSMFFFAEFLFYIRQVVQLFSLFNVFGVETSNTGTQLTSVFANYD